MLVLWVIEGAKKNFGSLSLNLSSVLSPSNFKDCTPKLIEEELSNTRIRTKIYLKLVPTFFREKQRNDQVSIGSGVSSSTTNNISNFSITNDQKPKDKKCIEYIYAR